MPDSFLRALGWVLAHSLWQAAVAALLLLILLPRLQTARQRYWTAYGALISVFAAAVGTFIWKFEPSAVVIPTAREFSEGTPAASSFLVGQQFLDATLSESFSQWLEANHALIVASWLIGFVFFLLRMVGGLWQVHRLRTRGVNALEAIWQEKMFALGGRMGVSRAVDLFESVWVHIPLTIGWLKPAILLPIGLVNQLSSAEVEAVLAHELAHIARRDWFFNLLQAFIESLFYYHPAVWWVSRVIRRERENACDDAALTATGNPLAFARALVQVQEMATPLPALALAMSGKRRRPLLDRVRRILNQAPQQQHQVMEKITATVILLALLALVGLRANSVPSIEAAFAQIAEMPSAIFGGQEDENQFTSDSLPKPKRTQKITREDGDQKVEAEYKDGELTRLNIDGKEIPTSEFDQHEELIEELAGEFTPPAPPSFGQRSNGIVWDSPQAPEPPEAPEAPEAPEPPDFFRFDGSGGGVFMPMPPFPPLASLGGISIMTDKDHDGNTIIKLDNHGNETEVVVKNGEVWIDGKKVEKGAEFLIPGLHFGQNDNYFSFDGSEGHGEGHGKGHGEGHGFSFGEGDFAWGDAATPQAISPEERKQINREMEQAKAEYKRAMKEHRLNYEQDQERVEKEWKESQKEWEKQQKNWQKEQQNWERKQKLWQEGQEKWAAQNKVWEAKSKAAQALIKQELLSDGLIKNSNDFSLKLSSKELIVNQKKQSEALRQKYEELLKGAFGKGFEGEDWNYNFNNSEDK